MVDTVPGVADWPGCPPCMRPLRVVLPGHPHGARNVLHKLASTFASDVLPAPDPDGAAWQTRPTSDLSAPGVHAVSWPRANARCVPG